MRKRFLSKSSFLAFFLLVFQVFISIPNVFAEGILPPSNLAVQLVTPSDIKLTWSSVYGATGYNIYTITDGQLTLSGTSKTTSYSINNLPEGTYSYVVSTLSAEGESGPCAPVQAEIVYPDMQSPSTLTYTIQNGNNIVLNWSASQNAQSYNVYQISPEDQKTLLTTVTGRTYTVSNVPAGNYKYAVSAVNSAYGESPLSAPVQVEVTPTTMNAPRNFTYTVTNGNDVNLRWDAVTYADSYKVYQVVDGEKVLKSTITGTTVTYTNMPAGDYKYEVHSYSNRFGESTEGSQLSVTVGAVTMAAPGNFTYKLQNINDLVLTWGAVPNATGYKVYQVIDGQKTLKSTVTGTTVTYTNMPAGDYVYEVHSYSDRFGESAEGSQLSITVGAVTMAAPGNFAYKIQNGNDIVLTWNSVPNANSYKVYQIVNGQKVLKSTVTSTTVTYASMPAGDYKYEVYSFSTRFGESQEGSQVSFSLALPTMEPPANLLQTIKSATEFSLSWDPAAYATNYKVYQITNGQKVLKSTVTGTSVSYTNMAPGEYNFEIHSYSSRFGESVEGSKLTVTLNGQTMEAPANLTYSINNGNDITLKWASVPYATSYKIYQVIDGEKVLKSTVTGTSVTYTNVPAGDYKYVVTSISTLLGESPSGAETSFSLTLPTMDAPGNFAYKIQNVNDAVFTWGAVPNANSYKLYELIDGQKVLKTTVTTLTTTLLNIPAGEHTYVIHSFSSRFGESAEGSQVSFTQVFPTMQKPDNLTYTIANGNDISLKWNTATYATAYNVYQIIDGQPVLKKTVTGTSVTFTNMPEGDYTYEVRSFSSRFGESPEGSQVSIKLTQNVMQAPGNLTQSITNGNDITLKWNSVTYATAYKVYQVIDGQPVLKKTVTSTSVAFTNMPEGDYTYEVHSFSDRFGESSEGAKLSFTLDFPTMQAPGNLTQSITNGNDITLKWNGATYATAYKVYQIVDGQPVLKKTVTSTSVTFTDMPQGDYTYEVHSFSDRFGESPAAGTLSFTLTWPVVQPPVLQSSLFNANNMTFTWKAVTWANEYRLYKVTGDSKQLLYKGTALTNTVYNLAEGNHSFQVTAYSTRFGESAPSNLITEKIVYPIMQAPTASIKLLSSTEALISWNFITYANGYNVYEIIDGKPVQLTKNLNNLSYKLSNLTYADHEYYVTSFSNSFGESERSNTVIAKLIIDTEAPVTTAKVTPASASTGWANQSAVVSLSATDNEVGVAKTFYSLDGGEFVEGTDLTISEEGIHKLSFYSVDKVGNKEAAKTIDIKVDKTAPVTKANEISDTFTQSSSIKLSATDALSGVAKTFYSINGSDYKEGTSFTVSGDGTNKISYYSIDQAGNTEKPQTIEVKVDNTAPVTTSDAPTTWSKDDVTVSLTATDTESGVAKTFYSINGSEYKEGTSFTVSGDGTNKISYYSIDQAGNTEKPQTVEVKIDKMAPVTTSNAPTAWSKDDVTVSLTATDTESGVAKTFYSINGSEYKEGTSFTVSGDGTNKISYYSIDQTGNTEKPQTIEVKIDKTAPVTTSDAPTTWSKDNVTVSLTATDTQSGISKTFYSINGSEYKEGTSFTVDKEGITQISYYSVDQTGNIEKPQNAEVKIDRTAPIVTMDVNKEIKLGTSLLLEYTAKDDQSGIASEKMVVTDPTGTSSTVMNGSSITINKQGVYNVSVTVTNAAGLSTTIQRKFSVYIPATIEVTPKIVKGNSGVFTVRVDLPSGYSTQGFDLNTAELNGVKALSSNNGYYNQAKLGQFKFERSDFTWSTPEVAVEFRGYVNGALVVGQTMVKVQK
ncbi:OmpL47-type beta-barrel domain-containing protein [Aneurinibacillus uraniidurans]|uniref:OmpL47-type beta-barrel domain-containing protein n=1 Tax=Aneurinibacillus uraniidurans TaxID=2966586 RepID=UPI00234B8A57|nr:hypothetical protein [Aneurinibacillus sp. B1]WCN37447.1 hypothetical protein PO771_16825 [Aneurinibacillus sp. B1]